MDFKQMIGSLLEGAAEIEDAASILEVPPDAAMGDFAFPCFKLAKVLRKAPPLIAAEIAGKLAKPSWLSNIEVKGAYINFFLNKVEFAQAVLEEAHAQGERYGSSDIGGGRVVTMDYSSINIAKPFHIGHLSTTAIGLSLIHI